MKEMTLLNQVFGYDAFRSGQKELIDALLNGQDVMGTMPIGTGKSLCYQLPALMLPGLTLVVTPPSPQIREEITALRRVGVAVAFLENSLSPEQYAETLRRVPADGREETPLGGKIFFVFLLMCFPLMYVGNLIGTLLSALLSGGAAENPLLGFAFDDNPIKLLVMVVLAPLFEEWFFRKQLIDHSARYGEKTAILLSALAFALFHGNLYQLFYAFALGLLFAYVYVRTRRLRYPVLLHMIVNFMGTVVGPLVLSAVDMEALEQVQSGAMDEAALTALLPGVGVLMLYGLVIIGLSIAGLVLLILRARRLVFLPAEEELPKEGRFQTVYASAGMILYALLCIGLCVASLFLS